MSRGGKGETKRKRWKELKKLKEGKLDWQRRKRFGAIRATRFLRLKFGPDEKLRFVIWEGNHSLCKMTSTSWSPGTKCRLPRSERSFICLVHERHGFAFPQFLSIPLSTTTRHKFPAGFNLKSSTYQQHYATSRITNSNALKDDHDGDVCGSSSTQLLTPDPTVHSGKWRWRGYSIRYQCSGDQGPALVLVHGFGANSDHWRKNLPVLGKSHRVYSIDLIGYGYSDKPNPRDFGDTPFYTFQTWASQLTDFCVEVVKGQAFFICNSIGGLVGLQAAVMAPHICKGLVLLNISLRMLHIKKQPPLARPLIKSFQSLLRNTALGKLFFRSVATPQSVRNILRQCYHDTSQVTDELVETILRPGLEPGAADVFLEFICYSNGPLPEELLPEVQCPVLIAWGDKDPWEPIELGRAYGNFKTVEEFVVLPDVGHCPQDEAPHLVNPLVESFVARHSATEASIASESLV